MPEATHSPPGVHAMLEVRDLAKHFDVSKPWLARLLENQPRQVLKAVDGLSFDIKKGETFSLVGESGCGKSTVAKLVVGLHDSSGGEILFDGANIADAMTRKQSGSMRRRSHSFSITAKPNY